MSDKKQVMFDIERCICRVPDACRDCSHYTGTVGFGCMEDLLADALALLKEQEPKLVRIDEDSVHCPSCGNELFTYPRQKFCDECGQELRWK